MNIHNYSQYLTKAQRRALRSSPLYVIYESPLMKLGTWMCNHNNILPNEKCIIDGCLRLPKFFCENEDHTKTVFVCGVHSASCCKHIRNKKSIRGAPWHLLEAAQVHVENRLISHSNRGRNNHQHRITTIWLGKWIKIIEEEMKRRKLKVIK